MADPNPYHPTVSTRPTASTIRHVASSMLWWVVYFYPVILVGLFYGCWELATLALGHVPDPSLDHPRNWAIDTLSILAAMSYFAWPLMIPAGLVWSFTRPFSLQNPSATPVALRWLCVSSYLLMAVADYWIISKDPQQVFYWFWD